MQSREKTLENRIFELSQREQFLEHDILRVKEENNKLVERNIDLERIVETSLERNSKQIDAMIQLQEILKKREVEIESAQDREMTTLLIHEERIRQFQSEIIMMESLVKEQEGVDRLVVSMKDKLDDSSRIEQDLRDSVDRLEKELGKVMKQREDESVCNNTLLTEMRDRIVNLELNLKGSLESHSETQDKIQKERELFERERSSTQDQNVSLKADLDQLHISKESEMHCVGQQLASLRQDKATLQSEGEILHNQYIALLQENQYVKQQMDQLVTQNLNWKISHSSLEKDSVILKERNGHLEHEKDILIESHEIQLKSLQNRNIHLQSSLDLASLTVDSLMDQLKSQQLDKKSMEESTNLSKEKIQELTQSMTDLESNLTEQTFQYNWQLEVNNALQQELTRVKNSELKLRENVVSLENNFKQMELKSTTRILELESEVTEYCEIEHKLSTQLDKVETQLNEAKNQLEEKVVTPKRERRLSLSFPKKDRELEQLKQEKGQLEQRLAEYEMEEREDELLDEKYSQELNRIREEIKNTKVESKQETKPKDKPKTLRDYLRRMFVRKSEREMEFTDLMVKKNLEIMDLQREIQSLKELLVVTCVK
jgi:hypothetical protein